MKFDNLDESWSFTTRISGSDPQIYPGTFLFLWLFVRCPWKLTVERHSWSWKPKTYVGLLRFTESSKISASVFSLLDFIGVLPLRVTCVFLTVAALRINWPRVICDRVVLSRFLEAVCASAKRNFLNHRTTISARFGQGVCGPVGTLFIVRIRLNACTSWLVWMSAVLVFHRFFLDAGCTRGWSSSSSETAVSSERTRGSSSSFSSRSRVSAGYANFCSDIPKVTYFFGREDRSRDFGWYARLVKSSTTCPIVEYSATEEYKPKSRHLILSLFGSRFNVIPNFSSEVGKTRWAHHLFHAHQLW